LVIDNPVLHFRAYRSSSVPAWITISISATKLSIEKAKVDALESEMNEYRAEVRYRESYFNISELREDLKNARSLHTRIFRHIEEHGTPK
jgi:3'-phosphoadenosine 5'-phosphosulfate sulfotransferase